MDEIDEKIIYLLRTNPHTTLKEISKKIRKPISTVHSRIKRLKSQGVIKESKLILDWEHLGYNVLAFVVIFLEKKQKSSAADTLKFLKNFGFVEDGYILFSKGDIVLKIRAKDNEELYDITSKLKSLPPIQSLEIILGKDIK